MCSTPFGIGSWFANYSTPALWPATECSTPFGIGSWFASPTCRHVRLGCRSAQRLSALDLGSPTSTGPCGSGETCAQRLSALDLGSLAGSGRGIRRGPCAQRLSALDLGSQDLGDRPRRGGGVLNAFRHWILVRSSSAAIASLGGECSTPFGIGSWFAARRRPVWRDHEEVLNAFRHWILVRRGLVNWCVNGLRRRPPDCGR